MNPSDNPTRPADLEALQKVAPEVSQFLSLVRGYQEVASGMVQGLQKALATIGPFNNLDFVQLMVAVSSTLQTLPDRTKICATKATLRGWFIGPFLPVSALNDLESMEDGNSVDAYFVDHYRESWRGVEKMALDRSPTRRALLAEAFAAHRERRYALSIPVFLAQADGLCDDALKGRGHLFAVKDGRIRERIQFLEELLAAEDSRFLRAAVEPLRTALPSAAAIHEWEVSRDTFNRNAILHGRDMDYASEPNSLRSISLIDSLVWALHDCGSGVDPA